MAARHGKTEPIDLPAGKKKGVLSRLAKGVTNSPKLVRKAMGSVKKRLAVGKSKANSSLANCQDNGWIYKDSDITQGVNYKVKYLGSVEVEYDATNTDTNQENAQKAMRALYGHAKASGAKANLKPMALSVSMDRMTLTSMSDDAATRQVMMRHSTTRIAYSTVDTAKPKIFAYVAVVKSTELALCHVFKCKSAKQGYEMTFVCAQAFDMNYRRWREDADRAKQIAKTTEATDVDPTQAWQRKKTETEAAADAAKADADGGDAAAPAAASAVVAPRKEFENPSPLPDDHVDPVLPAPTKPKMVADRKIFLAIREGQDAAELAASYFASLGVSMIEEVEDNDVPVNVGGMMQATVEPDAYNAADNSAGGYMTVGSGNMNFGDDDDDDDDDTDDEL